MVIHPPTREELAEKMHGAPWLTGLDLDTWLWMKCGFAFCVYCHGHFPGAHGADYACPECLVIEQANDTARKATAAAEAARTAR